MKFIKPLFLFCSIICISSCTKNVKNQDITAKTWSYNLVVSANGQNIDVNGKLSVSKTLIKGYFTCLYNKTGPLLKTSFESPIKIDSANRTIDILNPINRAESREIKEKIEGSNAMAISSKKCGIPILKGRYSYSIEKNTLELKYENEPMVFKALAK